MVEGAEDVEVEDEEATGIVLGLDPSCAAWPAYSSSHCALRRSFLLWGWG